LEIADFVWNHVIDNFIGESNYFFGESYNYILKDFFSDARYNAKYTTPIINE
jgi:hypothetical protein